MRVFAGRVPTDTVWDLVARRAALSGDEAVVAFVVPAAGVDLDPQEYRVVEALPRTSIGTVEKKTLRAMVGQPA